MMIHTAGGEPIPIPTSEEVFRWHVECWDHLNPELRTRISVAAHQMIRCWEPSVRIRLRQEIRRAPFDWSTPYHFWEGMQIRNALRQQGILDRELPTGNWDDYWVMAVEAALPLVQETPSDANAQ